jgi:hypothetical protein
MTGMLIMRLQQTRTLSLGASDDGLVVGVERNDSGCVNGQVVLHDVLDFIVLHSSCVGRCAGRIREFWEARNTVKQHGR